MRRRQHFHHLHEDKTSSSKELHKQRRSYFVFAILGVILILANYPSNDVSDLKTIEIPIEQYSHCNWITNLLHNGPSLSDNLPEPGVKGKRAGGNVFWLKRPLKHTKANIKDIPTFSHLDPNLVASYLNSRAQEVEIMILRYNIYNPKGHQHSDKFFNTNKILSKNTLRRTSLFPKLYASCNDIDGYHTIAVEYIGYNMKDLPKPETLENCFLRAKNALKSFEELHEEGLVLVDMKRGQWMSRGESNGIVLQDVDDIVLEEDAKIVYKDQEEWFQKNLKSNGASNVEDAWEKMFPNGKLNWKYNVIGTEVLLKDLGFRWREKDCRGLTKAFDVCLEEIFKWSRSIPFEIPSFHILSRALEKCYEHRNEQVEFDFYSAIRQ